MVRVEIRYLVRDREDQKLRGIDDIVNDLEREFWYSPFLSEASEYCIVVEDETGYTTRESRRKKQ